MNTLDQLYGRTESGLMVPHSALPSRIPDEVAAALTPKMSRQVCRYLERRSGKMNRCKCGRVISMNKTACAECARALPQGSNVNE